MNYLVDTNIFLWWIDGNKRLKSPVKEILEEVANTIYISVGSIWEMSIKISSGKLKAKYSLQKMVSKSKFQVLPIFFEHVLELKNLPRIHKDPFDRVLIAQAKAENLLLITSDSKIWKYNSKVIKT